MSWASFATQDEMIENNDNSIQLDDQSIHWTADEASKYWQMTSPTSQIMVPLSTPSHQIHTVLGSFDPLSQDPPLPPSAFRDHFDVDNTRLIIVQLIHHDRTAIEDLVNSLGLVDLDHIPDDSYLMRLPADAKVAARALDELSNHPMVRSLLVQHPGWRLQPELMNLSIDSLSGGEVKLIDVDITPAGDLSSEQLVDLQISLLSTGAEEVRCDAWLCQVRGIDPAWFSVIANDGRILFTESRSMLVISNDYARDIVRIDEVISNHNSGLDGTGEVAAISDSGLDSDHGDFNNRLLSIYHTFGPDSSGADTHSGHGTHVAGIMLGDGSGDSNYQGMAPATTFHFYQMEHDQSGQLARWGSLYDMFRDSRQKSASVHSNSWGSENMGGQYTSDSRSADSFMDDYNDYTVLFAAGNEGSQGSTTIAPPSTAKNVMTIGASTTGQWGTPSAGQVASFSSRGNTLDGRIKPDVVAPGVQICSARAEEAQYPAGPSCSNARHGNNDPMYMSADGTSAATPVTSGASVLVRQFLRTQMSVNQPHSDLIKAIVINGAKDIGTANIPNADEGWGQVDLQRSIYPTSGILSMNTFFDQEQSLTPGYSYLYTYSIDGSYGLSVTLVWNDREGSSSSSQSSSRLVNNLDLLVSAPDGTQYKGNVFQNGLSTTGGSPDNLNNVERVKLGSTQTGNWSIQVSNSGGAEQDYSVVITAMGNENPVSDLATISNSLWVSTSDPLEGETLIMGANWVNQAPSTTGSYEVKVDDLTTGMMLYNKTKSGLSGGTSDSIVFTHTFVTTGFHDLRLTIDVHDEIDEPNDFNSGINNNIYDLQVNVSAIGVRITPYLPSGQIPDGANEIQQARTRHIDPTLDDETNFRFKISNEGTSNESIDLRVSPVQFQRPDGVLDAPSDTWLKFLSIDPYYQLEPIGSGNNEIILDLDLRDETADLDASPLPIYALPGTYVVDVTAWYRSNPQVSHTMRFTIIVEDVDGMITALSGVSGLTGVPGEVATFGIAVRNPGNSPSVYNISCETPNRWLIALGDDGNSSSITLEPIPRLEFRTVTVRVTVPPVSEGHPFAGVVEDISCTTTHTQNPSLTNVDSTTITVSPLYKFGTDLYSSSGVPVGPQGNALDEAVDNNQDLNLTLTVSNLGNVPIALSVAVSTTLTSWPYAIFCNNLEDDKSLSLNLVEGESVDCRIQVHVPAEVSNGDSNTIFVETRFSQTEFILNRTELKVEERPDLSLVASPIDVINVAPGESSFGSFIITNEGNVPLQLGWEFGSFPEGWQVGFKTMPIDNLGMHRNEEIQISVFVPAGTALGPLTDSLTLMVTGTTYDGEELVRSATIGFIGVSSSWLTLNSDDLDFERMVPDEIRTGNLTVTNNGNSPCKVDFIISGPSSWVVSGLSTIQSLEAGNSQTIEFTIKNNGGVGSDDLIITAVPTSSVDTKLINGTTEVYVSSTSLTSEDGGLLKVLESAGVPSWALLIVALVFMGVLVGAVLVLRRGGSNFDSGEQILSPGSTIMGSIDQRRDAALDIGLKEDDMVSGSVSQAEIAAALASAGPGPLAPPRPPGAPPAPLGAPPLPGGSPPPPSGYNPERKQ